MPVMMKIAQSLATEALGLNVGEKRQQQNHRNVKLTFATMAVAFCITSLMDIADISLAIAGAFLYWLLTRVGRQRKAQKVTTGKSPLDEQNIKCVKASNQHSVIPQAPHAKTSSAPSCKSQQRFQTIAAATPAYLQPSAQPVLAPKFNSIGLDGEVQELLCQISPTTQTDKIVKGLVQIVREALKPLFPEANVTAFASGNPLGARAFATAVPEVDVVLNVDTEDLRRQFPYEAHFQERQLIKSVIRKCSSELVSLDGLKFRRSAFQSEEPKIILAVPTTCGLADVTFAMSFSVNTPTAQRTAALLKECEWIDIRAKELVLLVRRWARDRGLCHAPKGHLSPYGWTLLSMFFLQKGLEEDGALLPPMDYLAKSCGDKKKRSKKSATVKLVGNGESPKKTCVIFFKEFMQFYLDKFDLSKEVVSVCEAPYAKPKPWLMPIIEDPFYVHRNVGDDLNSAGLQRIREELARAQVLCARGASLSELLEPWVPPVDDTQRDADDGTGEAGSKPALCEKGTKAALPGQLTASIPHRLAPQASLLSGLPQRLAPNACS